MINSVTSSHTHDGGRVSYTIQIKAALLKPVYYSWIKERWIDL